MKTTGNTLSVGSRLRHLYRPLIRNLLIILGLTLVLAAAIVVYFDARMVRSMSAAVIDSSTSASARALQRMVNSLRDSLLLAQGQVADVELDDPDVQAQLLQQLIPFLETYPRLDSINLADTAGDEVAVLRDGDAYLTRTISYKSPATARWQRWAGGEVVETWERQTDVSPTERPWFLGAMGHEPGERYWTAPYRFLSTDDVGLSVSTRWPGPVEGASQVLAFNINLADVSRFTMEHAPSPNGLSLVLDSELRALGLPGLERFDSEDAVAAALLLTTKELNVAEVTAAVDAWQGRGQVRTEFPFTAPDGKRWWAGFATIGVDPAHSLWSVVLVPTSDLLGSLRTMRNLTLAGVAGLGALIAAGMFAAAMRRIRRQMQGAVDHLERKLGQYRLEQKIGEGGNGSVFRAKHALLRRPTALKLMNPAYSGSDAARDRFEHEVQLTSGLTHPNTISIFDYGRTADGTLYYAMELLNGSTLERLVRATGPLPADRAIYLLRQACGSLSEAHEKGLIHRDIKPSNIIACERGGLYDVVKVLDFGLVKEISEADGNLTQTDLLVGTPFYMAPETIREAGAASPASDIYSIGAVAYYLLTAANVFEGGSAVEICSGHLHDDPVPPSRRVDREIPADLEQIVLQCLEKEPADRPASAAVLEAALAKCKAAGSWRQAQARQWWEDNGSEISGVAVDESAPMSRTEMLIDMDTRLATGKT